ALFLDDTTHEQAAKNEEGDGTEEEIEGHRRGVIEGVVDEKAANHPSHEANRVEPPRLLGRLWIGNRRFHAGEDHAAQRGGGSNSSAARTTKTEQGAWFTILAAFVPRRRSSPP